MNPEDQPRFGPAEPTVASPVDETGKPPFPDSDTRGDL